MVHEHEDDSDVLIECRDVYKSFGEKHILKGVNFKVISILLLFIKFHRWSTVCSHFIDNVILLWQMFW